ncbi:MAG: hypothetical protein NVSMB21_07800 [Vulcanimicrobiaceae bacterium]
MIESLTDEQRAVVDADLVGPRLVDAGAGTGKTFTLVQRAAALVRRGALRADELLVVTFTKAAATEVSDRLERALGTHTQRRPTCGTFHAIAGGLVREFAYESGFSPDLRVVDDGRARGIFAVAFADAIAGRLDVDLSAFPSLDRAKALERSLAREILSLKARGADVSEALARARAAAAWLEGLEYGAVTHLVKARTRARAGWPKPEPPRSADERRDEAARERLNVDVVAAIFARFQALLDREHLMTFGDVIARATALLRNDAAIASTLRARWKHAIVDEFQDTNAEQIAFLEALFGAELVPVLAVGDVRQAIYEFNGARPEGIVEFRARARECLPLGINRRSLQPILDVAHAALAELGGVAAHLNTPLAAHRGGAAPTCVRLELFEGPDALEREAAAIAETIAALVASGVAPSACAVLLRTRTRAEVFARALRARGLAARLVGGVGFFDAPEIREVVAWLRLASDPTDAYATVAALQGAAIGLGDGAIAALARGGDLARGAQLDPVPPDLNATERARLERFRRTARVVCALTDAPLVRAVRAVIDASGADVARAAESDALAPGDALAQVRANLEKFVRTAADFAADRPLARLAELIAELRERDDLELDLPIAEIEGDRVPILTIHGAKGLEWDHVFVADVTQQIFPLANNDAREVVARFDPATGALALKHGVDGRPTLRWYLSAHEHDASGNVLERDSKSSLEEFRLMYVALTRARDAVYVTGRKRRKDSISKCFNAVRTWVAIQDASCETHRLSALHTGEMPLPAARERTSALAIARTLAARSARASALPPSAAGRRGALSYTAIDTYERCPRRARYRYVFGLPDFSDESPIVRDGRADRDGRDGDDAYDAYDAYDGPMLRKTRDPARYGRAIHLALETLAAARIAGDPIASTPAALDDALAAAFVAEAWSPSDERRLAMRTALARASAALESLTPLAAERRFDVTLDGVAVGGAIDLIARDARGVPVVVDYKTGRTAGEAYDLQFALYAYAVRDAYPTCETRLLRIGDRDARFETIVPASDERLRAAVANAASMTSDEPRPGAQCASCPYAYDACDAAPLPRTARVTGAP